MRDITELPGGTEQAKATPQKNRSTARSKPEPQDTGSQEQETKPASRRRTPTQDNASVDDRHSGSEQGSAPAPRHPGGEQGSAPAPRHHSAPPQQQHPSQPNQQNHGGFQRQNFNGPGQRSDRPAGPRNNTSPRPGGGYRGPNTGSGGTGYAPRPNTGPGGGGYGPSRPSGPGGGYGHGPSRPSGPGGGYAPRPSGGPGGGPGYAPRPSGGPGGGPGYAPSRPGAGTRGNHSGPSRGSGGSNRGSSHGDRERGDRFSGGGAGHRPSGRPSGGPGGNRSGARTNNNRSQEKRTAVVKEKLTGPITIPPQIQVKDLADMMEISPIEIIRDLISKHSVFASINQVIDYEKAALVAKDHGFEPSPSTASETAQNKQALSANEEMIASRNNDGSIIIPPVVTIMGHVDHGKTSLLDTIRKTKVADGEAGGITQHIGAYQVEVNDKKITFLDTPGHEAFTAMRARGAQVTHIAIIVVAADDGVMPQTKEAIDHAKAAKVPIIIALNKIDRPNANPDRVKQQLAEIGVLIEEYGGETVLVPVSAKMGQGIDELLDYILLVAEVQDIRANPNRAAIGVIIEAKLERNSGVNASVLVQQGTLKMGDNFVVGTISGKVRAMFNDRGKRIQKASPSTPVSILGLAEVPQAGDRLEVTTDERTAKQMAQQEVDKRRDEASTLGQVSLDTLYMQMQEGTVKELNLVLKSDVQGSLEAIKGSLSKLSEENLKVRLIHEGIGNISETDVHLASASGAIIIGFNVKTDGAAQREAQREGVDIRYYEVIYKLIEDIQAALTGLLEPTYREVIDGHAEIIQTFKAGRNLVIAGCRISDGKITRNSQARILRKGEKAFDGKVASIRRGKDDVREVATGYECGIVLEDFNEFEVGDVIEAYSQERVVPGA
ncbi:MAG TPA: translation initiation factor IF-2 [Dictyobacter sp.]|nr:translation initiation factor IF-2 [Dictyobacter sp.]